MPCIRRHTSAYVRHTSGIRQAYVSGVPVPCARRFASLASQAYVTSGIRQAYVSGVPVPCARRFASLASQADVRHTSGIRQAYVSGVPVPCARRFASLASSETPPPVLSARMLSLWCTLPLLLPLPLSVTPPPCSLLCAPRVPASSEYEDT